MSNPPGPYPGQPYDPHAQHGAAKDEQQAPGYSRADPTMLNQPGASDVGAQSPHPRADPTMLNPVGQPDPGYQQVPPADPTMLNPLNQPYQPVPPADPTMLNPLSQQDPAYHQGQPYDPQGQPYPSVPQYPVPQYQQPPQYQQAPYQQAPVYQQAPQQYPPQQGGFPPGPPGQGFPPQYGPGGPGSGGGGGGKVLAAIGSVLLTLLVIGGVIGLKVLKSSAKNDRVDASGADTTSFAVATSTAGAPTTRPSAKLPPITTAPPTTPKVTTVWLAAAYNEATEEVHWARSSISEDAAVGQAQIACGVSCQEPVWSKDACVAFAFGRNGGWASDWGSTITEAQDKAMARAQTSFDIAGPFQFWSKCAKE
ncbi:DUF4189 domain-containing protein [Nocardia sp. NPDC052316]|uniref:DUF4189 domain-containing protein n=1 Tax=Nocardia sp. NPDC052316 TaxID=3364329 RepID=UPI0037C6B842